MADIMGDLTSEPPSDPDAQATVTDFLDYTEYLPADLIRSLTLIRGLDETYQRSTLTIHELTKTYGTLPSIPPESRPDSHILRQHISHHLERAIKARESSYAEACRLYDVVDRHYNRLGSIVSKLNALPKPPSRDPTPAPVSPDNKRSRSGRKSEDSRLKITLRVPDVARQALLKQQKARNRRITVPGEVLPPFNPDSPLPSTEQSDYESEPESPIPQPTSRVGAHRKGSTKPEKQKPPKSQSVKLKPPKTPRPPRQPGMGTNVHSAVAGISTTNALLLLEPPPPNPVPGSEHAPWSRLTDYEMAVLRKQMKKNAIWLPSKTMVRKTLYDRGRGWENFRKAKNIAEANGEEVLDPEDISHWTADRKLQPGEIGPDEKVSDEANLSNRGMKLNEAKKRKKERLADEQAKQQVEEFMSMDLRHVTAEQQNLALQKLVNSAKSLKNLDFSSVLLASQSRPEKMSKSTPKSKATKAGASSQVSPSPFVADLAAYLATRTGESSNAGEPSNKKRKISRLAPVVTTTTTLVPILPAGVASASKASTPLSAPLSSSAESKTESITGKPAAVLALRSSAAPKATSTATSTPTTTRAPSLRRSAATSVEPSTISKETRDRPSRKSTPAVHSSVEVPAKLSTPVSAAAKRTKRPAPGPVTENEDGGAAVSIGRRKAAPKKKAAAKDKGKEKVEVEVEVEVDDSTNEVRIDEDGVLEEIDPNEPRYCLCGDVSYGEMICCENDNCEREWFHMACVDLVEPPGRTTKWYCPSCRKRLGMGEKTNGLVGGGRRR